MTARSPQHEYRAFEEDRMLGDRPEQCVTVWLGQAQLGVHRLTCAHHEPRVVQSQQSQEPAKVLP
jgi:hypothetical protein